MIERSTLSESDRYRLDTNAAEARFRRAALKELKECLCGPLPGSSRRSRVQHGPLVNGTRCERCRAVKNYGAKRARELFPELFR